MFSCLFRFLIFFVFSRIVTVDRFFFRCQSLLSFWFVVFVVILVMVWQFHFSLIVHCEGVMVGVKVRLFVVFDGK